MYSLAKSLLFKLEPELSHQVGLALLKYASPFFKTTNACPTRVMNINFPNPVGLAAGLDKNAAHVTEFARLGFGFIEVGTVTPKPQPGLPKPRLFRSIREKALINRMGFNNIGAEAVLENVKKQHYKGILGINIGKNAQTPLENAVEDYVFLLNYFYAYAHYVTVNISSPNTEGLRTLQQETYLKTLLEALKNQQSQLAKHHCRYVPLVIKLSPDLTEVDIAVIACQLMSFEIDGVIAVNTTITRENVKNSPCLYMREKGGLSGMPLSARSTQVVQQLYAILGEKVPIIASGGVMSAEDAAEKIKAGAKLVQLYTGLIYEGPALIQEIILQLKS